MQRLGADNRDVQDKDRFADICARRGFPHVPTLAVFERGRQIYPATPFTPDLPKIWTKSLRLKGGAGGAKWIRDGEAYRDSGGRRVGAAKLAEEFSKEDCLVQPFVENHPDIAQVTNGALASLRIVTGLNERAEAEFIASSISLPHGARETSVAGILCSIERETGRVRQAAFSDGSRVECHPDTGLPCVGITLPFWHESIELVRRAHAAAFPRFPFLGWDIALTKDGPILLETNSGWGAILSSDARRAARPHRILPPGQPIRVSGDAIDLRRFSSGRRDRERRPSARYGGTDGFAADSSLIAFMAGRAGRFSRPRFFRARRSGAWAA